MNTNEMATSAAQENAALTESRIVTSDGQRLHVFEAGSRGNPPVVFINAYAVQVGMIANTIAELAKAFHVITWEARCCLTRDLPFTSETRVDVDVQGDDMIAVMDHVGVSRAHVVGWCTGAVVGLKAAYRHRRRVASLALANGTYGFTEGGPLPLTRYQTELNKFMPKIANDRRAAEVLHRLVFQNRAFMDSMENEWGMWTRVPFMDPESMFRFGNSVLRILDERVDAVVGGVRCPVLVLTSDRDIFAHPEHSRYVAKRLANAVLFEDVAGDHYSVAGPRSASIVETVRFFKSQTGELG